MRTGRGAMLYDAACIDQPVESVFDREQWRARGAIEEAAGGRGTVAYLHRAERSWVLRHYRRGGLVAGLLGDRYLWTGAERTRAFVEWRLLRRLHDWDLPVPRAIAARYVRTGCAYRADLLTEELPTRLTLAQALAQGPLELGRWTDVGRCIAALHDRGVRHADLNAHNLLLGDGRAVYVLDFDRGRIVPRGRWEQDVIARLERSLRKVTAGLPPDRYDDAARSALLEGCASR